MHKIAVIANVHVMHDHDVALSYQLLLFALIQWENTFTFCDFCLTLRDQTKTVKDSEQKNWILRLSLRDTHVGAAGSSASLLLSSS